MRALSKIGNDCNGTVTGAIGTLLFVLDRRMLRCCREDRPNSPTPSAPGAEVYFVDLKDGDVVSTKLKIHFGLKNMGVAPAGSDRPNSGHHHLLIDTELPPLNEPVPNDPHHLHFGAGQNGGRRHRCLRANIRCNCCSPTKTIFPILHR